MEGKAMTKNVANPEDKDEVWKKSGFAGRVQSLRENGLRKDDIGIYLTPEQEEFLREATWESYRKIQLREVPGRMSNAQYKMKSDLIASWRAHLQTVRLLRELFVFERRDPDAAAWFKAKDARKVLDKEAVVEIVGTCVDYFGQEYADAILERLRNAYGARGEEIVIQRRP